jgi:hypothetical protein
MAQPREATITLGRDPEPPFCVMNPGGTINIDWNIEHQTTPNRVEYYLQDPTRTINLEQQTYPGGTGLVISRSWNVPNGATDGKYWIRVEYWSFESGNESNAEVTFYVCTDTGSLCLTKLADSNCNGQVDPGIDQPVPGYWLCLTTPEGDDFCKQTGADGTACWSGIPLGDYTVYEAELPGWEPVGPTSYAVTLVNGDTQSFTFLNRNLADCYHACCLLDGSCVVVLEATCTQLGGTWHAEPSCDGVACPPPPSTGACCFIDGSCQVLTQEACVAASGQFQGNDVPCTPGLCPPPVPTERSSWGQIKNLYR